MEWTFIARVLCALLHIVCIRLTECLHVDVDWGELDSPGTRLIFHSGLGPGWSYKMLRRTHDKLTDNILSLDGSSGQLFVKPNDICANLQTNPLEVKIHGQTNYHLSDLPANSSVTSLTVLFHTLPCSVLKYRKTVPHYSLPYHSIKVILYSNHFALSPQYQNPLTLPCLEKDSFIFNVKHYIPNSIKSALCDVRLENDGFSYNSTSSVVSSRFSQCLLSSKPTLSLKIGLCEGTTQPFQTTRQSKTTRQSITMLVELHFPGHAARGNPLTGDKMVFSRVHSRSKRQTTNNPPRFPQSSYTTSVKENKPADTSVITISAEDDDGGQAGVLTYSISAKYDTRSNNMFTVDPISGKISTTVPLDREEIAQHTFYVTATDSGTSRKSAIAELVIDVEDENDHTPAFDSDSYTVEKDENLAVKSVIITVRATDGDAGDNAAIRFSIIEPPNSATFQIGPISGVISTLRTLDREVQASYRLVVQAIDQAPVTKRRSSTATILLTVKDENDNSPQFTQDSYTVNVSENLDVTNRPVIAYISATDADEGRNSEITYSITNGNTDNTFAIDRTNGQVSVQKHLNYESNHDYQLRIKAIDGGEIARQNSTTLWVRVEDINDNPPRFQSNFYKGSVLEGASNGHRVLTVHALDIDSGRNAMLQYSFVNTGPEFPFAMNADSGRITVRSTVDREIQDVYTFTVQVKDQGETALSTTASVQITVNDVNDNSPVFAQKTYYESISEAAKLYTVVRQVTANDADSDLYAALRYEIVSGNTNQVFSISRETGIITLQKRLDFKIQNKYILRIRAYDIDDKFDSADVHINVTDVNKESPQFESSSYEWHIYEGLDIGTLVGKVSARDSDFGENGRITYEVVDNVQEFSIDPNTGEIVTREVLDRELSALHSLDVRASDHGNPQLYDTASVYITVQDTNDNAPEFVKKVFTANVSEAATVNTVVTTVSATDDDTGINARIQYQFAETSDGQGDFAVDASGGAILVAKNNHIDRETQNNYTLTILAIDGGVVPLTGTVEVKIKIDDVNDNPPHFGSDIITVLVQENLPIGSTVAVIEAVDPDEGVFAVVYYSFEGGLDADKFVLSYRPGEAAVIVNHIDLDYESAKKEYQIRLKAESGTLISSALIIIQVQDVNDNVPVLKDFTVIFNNYVDHFPSGPVGRIPAFDPDISDQPKLNYTFLTGNEAHFLKLNHTTGEITLDSRLNSDVPRNSTIQVKVSDGVNEVRATCRLHVRLVTIDMVENSVTIRINNMTSAAFLSPLYGFFVAALSTIINVNENNIYVINVRNDTDVQTQILNVTVAVREKTVTIDRQTVDVFYTPEYLKEQIYLQRTLLANLSTLQVLPFDDNLCVVELCPYFKRCMSMLTFGQAAPFITSDTMLFRPIYPDNGYRCICPEGFTWYDKYKTCDREVNLCYSNPCQNEATCHSKEGGYTCECKTGFTGTMCEIDLSLKYETAGCPADVCQAPSRCVPLIQGGIRCEGCPNTYDYDRFCRLKTRNFPKGSFLMYPTLKSRYRFKIQLWFATQHRNGLLLYNGRFNELHDFMALEIVDAQVQFSFSTGEHVVKVSPYIEGGVNDGKWHQVTVDYLNMTATVSVGEDCDSEISVKYGAAINYTCAARGTLTFKPACFKEGNVNNCAQLLDLTGPLQIGGLPTLHSNFQIQNKHYIGCMKDLYIDNNLLDFNKYVANNGTLPGCSRKLDFCLAAPCKHGGTCLEGWDSFLCACPDRWGGKDCSLSIEKPRSLSGDGYLSYSTEIVSAVHFSKGWYNGISFRTRDKNGTLLFIVAEGGETIILELINGYLTYSYINSQPSQKFTFDSIPVDDGQWHFFETRWLNTGDLVMELDYGQQQKFSKIRSTLASKRINKVYAGAIKLDSSSEAHFTGCIQNVQVGNDKNSVLSVGQTSRAPEGCSSGDACSSSPCPTGATCIKEWQGHTCQCPPGTLGPNCESICTTFNPCQNEAYCRHPQGGTYQCECGEMSGKYCQHVQESCPQKWWGFPVCGPCPTNCTLENGFNPNCDNTTGQCSCKANYYRPSGSEICLPCNCYGHGSQNLKCHATTGQCACIQGVIGRRCDQCPSKYAEIRKDEETLEYGCRVDYEACPRIYTHGQWWDTEVANVQVSQACPDNAVGSARRNCTASGMWEEPNFFNCTHQQFIEHLKKTEEIEFSVLEINTFVAKTTMASLADSTSRMATMYGNDLNITLSLMVQLLDFENKQVPGLNLTSEQDSRYLSNMVTILSDILQEKYTDEWRQLNADNGGAGELINKLENYLEALLSALELTNPDSPRPYNVIADNLVLSVDYINKKNFTGRSIPKFNNIVKTSTFDEDTNIMLPKSILSASNLQDFLGPETVVAPKAYVGYMLFKELGDLLPKHLSDNVRNLEDTQMSINAPVFTVIVKDDGKVVNGSLSQPVAITFKQLQAMNRTSPQCVAWQTNRAGIGEWSTAGCSVADRYAIEDDLYVKCSCNHMTSFALLMDVSNQEYVAAEPISLQIITFVGLVICMGCLFVTYIVLFIPKRVQSNANSIHLNLMFVMFVTQLTFLVGIDQTEPKLQVFCRLVAIFLHYFFMTGFSWLFVDILHIYRMLTEIRNIDTGSMKFYYLIAYVIPGIIVSLAVGLNTEAYGNSSFCWLSMTDRFIWSFAGPVTLSVIINIFVFVMAVRGSCREKIGVSDVTPLRIGMFANIMLLMIWGILWVIGLLSVNYNLDSLHVMYALFCLALGVFSFIIYVIVNSQVRLEVKKLWYRCSGQKLDLDDNMAGTRSSVCSRSALAYRNDSCEHGLSPGGINVGISTNSTTSHSTSKSSGGPGGLYRGEDYLRSTGTSSSGNMPPIKYPMSGNLPPPYGYDPDQVDSRDPECMQQMRGKRDVHDSDTDSEMSEHVSLDLASSHSSDDEDEMDVRLDWDSRLPANKKIEDAREQIRKKKEEMLQQEEEEYKQQQQQQQHHYQQLPAPLVPTSQHQYHNPFDHVYSGPASPKFSPKSVHTPGNWPGDPQLSTYTASDSEYRSEQPPSTLSSTQPDVTLQTPEYKGREFKVATQRHMDSVVNDSPGTDGRIHSPVGSPQVKHTPLDTPASPSMRLGSPLIAPQERLKVKVLTHRGSITSDSEDSHETCV